MVCTDLENYRKCKDKLHTFSLGEIDEPAETDTTEYRKAKRAGEHDSRGRKMPVVDRKCLVEVSMTNKEYELFMVQVLRLADKIIQRRNNAN